MDLETPGSQPITYAQKSPHALIFSVVCVKSKQCTYLIQEQSNALGCNNLYIGTLEARLQSSNKEAMYGSVCHPPVFVCARCFFNRSHVPCGHLHRKCFVLCMASTLKIIISDTYYLELPLLYLFDHWCNFHQVMLLIFCNVQTINLTFIGKL